MDPLFPLLTAIAVSLLLSTVILRSITNPLRRVLALLCKDGESTPFWTSFTGVMLYIAPLFFAVLWTPIYHTDLVYSLRIALIASLFGAFAGMAIVGYRIGTSRGI
jgi:hypothetical protein